MDPIAQKVVSLFEQGMETNDIADMIGYNETTIDEIIQNYLDTECEEDESHQEIYFNEDDY